MANGFQALKGFEYQATVTLHVLLENFHLSGVTVEARPEGQDDLVLRSLGSQAPLQYVQIKKPRENVAGELTKRPWSLNDAVKELLPGTFARLRSSSHKQTWILGDDVDIDVRDLFAALEQAPQEQPENYLTVLHRLIRNALDLPAKATKNGQIDKNGKTSLERWHFSPPAGASVDSAVGGMIDAFLREAGAYHVPSAICDQYRQDIWAAHAELPNIISRIKIQSTYGTDDEIRMQVQQHLMQHYQLPAEIVKHTLLRNLRGFVQDIAIQNDRWVGAEEFELELRAVWPRMTLVGEPPPMLVTDLRRNNAIRKILTAASHGPVDVKGVSGSGKTKLASSILEYVRSSGCDDALYAEVRAQGSLRDVLAGVAFHLRRRGYQGPFRLIVSGEATDEKAIREMGRALRTLPLVLLVDLVDGVCSDGFAKDLAALAEELALGQFRLIVLGQESGLRAVTPFQRKALAFPPPIDMQGFDFEEFLELVGRFHQPCPDRTKLWDVFERLTGMRSSGLLVRLASTLAQSASLEEMQGLAVLPPGDALAEADRARFNSIREEVRGAAKRLVCFALPFRREEAESLFPRDSIVEAVQELLQRGLLRYHDDDRFETHETVRAGLERLIPLALRQETHAVLAADYLRRGDVIAGIWHLEQAGQVDNARQEAQKAFMAFKNWDALAPYVAKHRLITISQIVSWYGSDPAPKQSYLLPEILETVGDAQTAEALLEVARAQSARFERDFNWAWHLTQAVLASDPSKIYELVVFALESISKNSFDRLEHVISGARRRLPAIDTRLLGLFFQQSDAAKLRLLPLLLLNPKREMMAPVLAFFNAYEPPYESNENHYGYRGLGTPLQLRTNAEIDEFLASIPLPQESQLIVRKSVLFERVGGWIWTERHILQPRCIDLLQKQIDDELVLENALRVLVFLGDKRVIDLADAFADRKSRLGTVASCAPLLMPSYADASKYRMRVFDTTRDHIKRTNDLFILIHFVDDPDKLLDELLGSINENIDEWERAILACCAIRPCKVAVPLLEKKLADCKNDVERQKYLAFVPKIAELHSAVVTDFLIRLLKDNAPLVRIGSAFALQSRRSCRARPALIDQCLRETDAATGQIMLVAAIMCGPTTMVDFEAVWTKFPAAAVWRCVLAERLGAASENLFLVEIAKNREFPWKLRRAAILAASALPYECALAEIAPAILSERSPFKLDKTHSLLAHHFFTAILQDEIQGMYTRFLKGRERFVNFFGELFDLWAKDSMARLEAPSGIAAANWLFDRLAFHGWPNQLNAADMVFNELHIPILQAAVLRGFRRVQRPDLIEQMLSTAEPEWLLLRGICELSKCRGNAGTRDEFARLSQIVDANPHHDSPYVKNCMKHHEPREDADVSQLPSPEAEESRPRELRYHDIQKALEEGSLPPGTPLIVIDLTATQFSELVKELSPDMDFGTRWIPAEPRLGFTAGGFSVHGVRQENAQKPVEVRRALRSALAAANRFGDVISWHRDLLAGTHPFHSWSPAHTGAEYAMALLRCLGAQGDPVRLYDELEANGDLIVHHCGDAYRLFSIRKLIDLRIVPFLSRYGHAGTDGLLEALCWMASCVDDPAIDPILSELFHRWVHRFKPMDQKLQHDGNTPLWRAFNSLVDHSRFKMIPDYDLRIVELLPLNLTWYDKKKLVDAISDSPRAYVHIETMLLKAAPFEHFYRDEVDRLEDAAEALFPKSVVD